MHTVNLRKSNALQFSEHNVRKTTIKKCFTIKHFTNSIPHRVPEKSNKCKFNFHIEYMHIVNLRKSNALQFSEHNVQKTTIKKR